jgi:hypothetical protein
MEQSRWWFFDRWIRTVQEVHRELGPKRDPKRNKIPYFCHCVVCGRQLYPTHGPGISSYWTSFPCATTHGTNWCQQCAAEVRFHSNPTRCLFLKPETRFK